MADVAVGGIYDGPSPEVEGVLEQLNDAIHVGRVLVVGLWA
jgi:hypothetical protein